MKIVYIHGASATSESFARIRDHLDYAEIAIDYKSSRGFMNNLTDMEDLLKEHKKLFFIAHSLGGIYALHLANLYPEKTLGAVTLSTPYGGSREADFAKYFLPFSRLMRDIGPMDKPMAKVKELKLPAQWTNIVTTEGQSPWIKEPNDGVVTIQSMKFRKDMELIELPLNHYEVVVSDKTISLIRERINTITTLK